MTRSLPGRPFLKKIEIDRFRAKYMHWPPKDASPVIAIEPWGKQFFVFNGVKNVEIVGDSRAPDWGNTKPTWWREEVALSLLKPGEDPNEVGIGSGENKDPAELESVENMTNTHLCVTDFRKRPLLYFSKEELTELKHQLPYLKEHMEKFKRRLPQKDEAAELETRNIQTEDHKYMHIRRGRIMNPPQRSGRGVMSAPSRMPKKRTR
jgi:hypothetical protein